MSRVHGRKNGHNSGKSIIQEEAKGRWLLWKERMETRQSLINTLIRDEEFPEVQHSNKKN